MIEKTSRIALFVDAENEPNHIEELLKNLQERGVVFCRRIYGKTTIAKAKWQGYESLGLKIVANSSEKTNATDLYLSIDAMDILHQKKPDIICIASGDKDYIPLINAIRENGVYCIVAARTASMYGKLAGVCDEIIVLDEDVENTSEMEEIALSVLEQEPTLVEISSGKPSDTVLRDTAIKILQKGEMRLAQLCFQIYANETFKKFYPDFRFAKGEAKNFFVEQKDYFVVKGKSKAEIVALASPECRDDVLAGIARRILKAEQKRLTPATLCSKMYADKEMKEKYPTFKFGAGGGAKKFFSQRKEFSVSMTGKSTYISIQE